MKRIYEPAEPRDGHRVLVDRVWPRGVRKDDAAVDLWLRDVAPSAALRRWYGHDPERFTDFAERYRAELADPVRAAAVARLRDLVAQGQLTLLTATRDATRSQAAVLAGLLG